MTNSIFFDTDCICAFLWVKNECLLEKMYSGRIVIPKQVYDEIDNPRIPQLKTRIDQLIHKGTAIVMAIDIGSEEYAIYRSLTTLSNNNKVIGRGEAASISLAKKYNGILVSNNLRDVAKYVKEYSLKHVTTGDILVEALERGFISEKEGNLIWKEMLRKKRKIGAKSFTEYLHNKK